MATLVHPILPRRFTLGPRTLVGRANHCTFQLKNRLVSGEHALLTWGDDGWRLRDLGSRNGTFVDGQPVRPGERVKLTAGCELTFADERWHLADEGPPSATARLEGAAEPRRATDDLLFLPDEEDPRVMIFADRKTGDWIAEIGDEQQVVRDQEELLVGERVWHLGLPPVTPSGHMASTLGMDELTLSLSTLDRLRFVKQRDGSMAELTIWYRHKPIPVPVRSHHALLAALAGATLDDEGLPRPERGWRTIEALCDELAVDAAQLNTQIFRARRQFASMGVGGAARLIERRPQNRTIRLGVDRVEIRTL